MPQLDQTCADRGAATVGVVAGERQRAGARFGQAAGTCHHAGVVHTHRWVGLESRTVAAQGDTTVFGQRQIGRDLQGAPVDRQAIGRRAARHCAQVSVC